MLFINTSKCIAQHSKAKHCIAVYGECESHNTYRIFSAFECISQFCTGYMTGWVFFGLAHSVYVCKQTTHASWHSFKAKICELIFDWICSLDRLIEYDFLFPNKCLIYFLIIGANEEWLFYRELLILFFCFEVNLQEHHGMQKSVYFSIFHCSWHFYFVFFYIFSN